MESDFVYSPNYSLNWCEQENIPKGQQLALFSMDSEFRNSCTVFPHFTDSLLRGFICTFLLQEFHYQA